MLFRSPPPSPLPLQPPSSRLSSRFTPRTPQIDLAPYVGASLEVMKRDSDLMRDGGPTIFTSVKLGEGVQGVAELIRGAWLGATGGK